MIGVGYDFGVSLCGRYLIVNRSIAISYHALLTDVIKYILMMSLVLEFSHLLIVQYSRGLAAAVSVRRSWSGDQDFRRRP